VRRPFHPAPCGRDAQDDTAGVTGTQTVTVTGQG
jgi:hypothetical protein